MSNPHKPTICACGNHAFAPLTLGAIHIFDVQDMALAGRWRWSCSDRKARAAIRRDHRSGRKEYFHRAIIQPAEGYVVDHINGNQSDNRRSNLRVCTNQENTWNRRKRVDSSQRYKGVYKAFNRWRFSLATNGKAYSGSYETEEEAAAAYNEVALRVFGEFARLNAVYPNGEPATRSAITHPDIQKVPA